MKSLSKRCNLSIILGILILLSACKKDFLEGYDKTALFKSPVQSELDNIISDWQQRDLTPAGYVVLQEDQILNGKFVFKIVSYRVSGIQEYGALLIPETDTLLPVRMLIGGFGLGNSVNSLIITWDSAGTESPCILAIPALRGQSLEIILNSVLYSSPQSGGAHCNAFDVAADDAIAFLNLIDETEPNADVNRTGVRGGSRGGTVALLAGIRDQRIKRVVDVAGPVNLLELTAENENDPTYQCQFLDDLKSGQSTLEETRYKMIASSPVYFAAHLPLTQLHMGLNDEIVPINQGEELEQKIIESGTITSFQFYTYDRTHENIATGNTELAERIELFFSQL